MTDLIKMSLRVEGIGISKASKQFGLCVIIKSDNLSGFLSFTHVSTPEVFGCG